MLQLNASQRERLAAETAEERETRLLQLSASQRERLAAETAEEREARQLQWSASRRERLAAEFAEEREARLQCDRQRHREQVVVQSQLPLFQQHSVRSKMLRFHAHMASLDSPQCTTCSESYPGLRLGSQSTVCQRCTQDKHTPKLYSTANSMNPGPIPPQLQVSMHGSLPVLISLSIAMAGKYRSGCLPWVLI